AARTATAPAGRLAHAGLVPARTAGVGLPQRVVATGRGARLHHPGSDGPLPAGRRTRYRRRLGDRPEHRRTPRCPPLPRPPPPDRRLSRKHPVTPNGMDEV